MEGQAADEQRDIAIDRIVAGGEQAHARQRHVELLGGEHGQRGVHALPHLAAVHRQQHAAVARNLDPAIERDLALGQRQQIGAAEPAARRHHAPADEQRASGAEAGQQQRAALHAFAPALRGAGVCSRSSFAAVLIASRTRP